MAIICCWLGWPPGPIGGPPIAAWSFAARAALLHAARARWVSERISKQVELHARVSLGLSTADRLGHVAHHVVLHQEADEGETADNVSLSKPSSDGRFERTPRPRARWCRSRGQS